MDIRNNYLAHAGNSHSNSRFNIALALNPDPNEKLIIKTIFYVLNSMSFTDDEMNDFIDLLKFVREKLKIKISIMFNVLKKKDRGKTY